MNLRKEIREAIEDEEIPGFGRDYGEKEKQESEKPLKKEAPYINFENKNQVILYECELSGQISDGQWENSRPYDHWKVMSNAEARVGSPLGPSFRPRRPYNFAAGSLISVVGNRMIYFVKFYNAFPQVSFDKHWDINLSDFCDSSGLVLAPSKEQVTSYMKDKISEMESSLNSTIEEIIKKINAVSYSKGNLMNDLRRMSEIVNLKYRG
jgi:hypothetical protein